MRVHSRLVLSAAALTALAAGFLGAGGAQAARAVGPGTPLWTNRYAPGGIPAAVAASADAVFVTGSSADTLPGLNYLTAGYDAATGTELWTAQYNGPAGGEDQALAVAASPDGSAVFVTGASIGRRTGFDYATVAYNAATGARLWAQRYNGTGDGNDIAQAIAVSPDSTEVFVTGQSAGTHSGPDYATIAYDAATGAQLWVRRYTSPGNAFDEATSVAVNPDGGEVYVTGDSSAPGGSDYVTIGYDTATGTQLWLARYNGPANRNDDSRQVAVSPDGREVAVTGTSQGKRTGQDYATVAYNSADGARFWVKRYNGPGSGADVATGLAFSVGGKLFVTGRSAGAGTGVDYATVGYTIGSGKTIWVSRYSGSGDSNDAPAGIAVAFPGGQVYVTGTGGGGDRGLRTLAYDTSTGEPLWLSDYRLGGVAASAVACAIDQDQFFVVGYAAASGTGFITAYPAAHNM